MPTESSRPVPRRQKAKPKQPVWFVEVVEGGFRAELWVRPYHGWMLAATRIESRKAWATRDGRRIFWQWREHATD